ncbi:MULTISPECIES: hypothetical protein [unclassified Bacillus (in: firmicutes)]|uniref:hypothetical protein n=1 Tax=unclassified Bacillus (in: firmicutes) TaxID=185979 RepID=UPI0012E06588|nr:MULTISPECIES: hypothetical protein [unclassified Bacillus (in: firmicutes)]
MGSANGQVGQPSTRGGDVGWEGFLEAIVDQIEFVSSYYGYTEEYVLDHTLYWLRRKVEQALQEKYDAHTNSVRGQFQSYLLLLDSLFNKGAEFNKILPPTREQAIANSQDNADDTVANEQEQYDKTQWWLTPNES